MSHSHSSFSQSGSRGRQSYRYSLQEQDLAILTPSSAQSGFSQSFGSSGGGNDNGGPSARAFLSASQRLRPSPVHSSSPLIAQTTMIASPQTSSQFSPRSSSKRNSLVNSAVSFDQDFPSPTFIRRGSNTSNSQSNGDTRRRSQSADVSSSVRRLSTRMSVGSGFDIGTLLANEANPNDLHNDKRGSVVGRRESTERRMSNMPVGDGSPTRRFSTTTSKGQMPEKFLTMLSVSNPSPNTNIVQGNAFLMTAGSPVVTNLPGTAGSPARRGSTYDIYKTDSFSSSSGNNNSNSNNNNNSSSSSGGGRNCSEPSAYRTYVQDLHLRQASIWEPPLSCQRRMCHLRLSTDTVSPNQQYFSTGDFHHGFNPDSQSLLKHYLPLELTNRDYVTRLFGVIRFAVIEAFKRSGAVESSAGNNANSSGIDSNSSSNQSQGFGNWSNTRSSDFILDILRLLMSKEDSQHIARYWFLIVDPSFYPKQEMIVDSLTFHYFNIMQNLELDFGPLINMADVISVCKEFLSCLNLKYIYIVENCLKEIQDLEAIIKTHSTYKQQRMESLGWRWPQFSDSLSVDSSLISHQPSSQPGKPILASFSLTASSMQVQDPKRYVDDELKPNASRLKAKADALCKPALKNKIVLMSRLMCVCRDLATISAMCEKKQNFLEAKRMFELKERVFASIEEESGTQLLDSVMETSSQLKAFVVSVENDIIGMRIALDISDVIAMRNIVADLSKFNFTLQGATSRYSIVEDLLKNPQLLIEATEHITSLFIAEYHYADNETLAGLLIKSRSQSLLEAVWKWPNLVEEQKARLQLSRAATQLFDLNAGTGALVDIVQVMNLTIADIYEESETNYNVAVELRKSQIYNPNEVNVENPSSLGLKAKGLQLSKTFAAGATAILILRHLQSESAVSHTRLLTRLQGMAADIRTISEGVRSSISSNNSSRLNDFLSSEANRLVWLAETVDNSIDVDAVEPDQVVGGRSRQRIDTINEVLGRCEVFRGQLNVAIASAEDAFDFSATSTLRRQSEELAECISRVASSCKPFSLLDNIPNSRDLIHLKTTDFITGEFLLNLVCKLDNDNISSLAVVSSCSEVLFDINKNWSIDTQNAGFWQSRQSQLQGHSSSKSGGHKTGNSIDFDAPRILRRVGFSMEVLKSAGFSDVDILLAGYPIEMLRAYGFDAASLIHMKESGVSDPVIGAIGQYSLLQSKLMQLIFTSLGGQKWNDSRGWNELSTTQAVSNGVYGVDAAIKAVPFGTTYLASGALNNLILNSNNLQGYIPDCFQPLRTLTQLCMAGNKLSGSIPPSIYSLVNLTVLQLNNNSLTGEVGPAIKTLQNLTVLRLDNNKFSGSLPAALGELVRLKKVMLHNCSFTGTIHQINWAALISLQELYLNNNIFTGVIPETFGSMISLYSLNMQNNKFTGAVPSSFANLQRLSNLNISHNFLLPVDRLKLQKVFPTCHILCSSL